MSHEINEHDKQEGIFQAWHGKTDVKAVISLLTCWLAQWDVKPRTLWRIITGADGTETRTDSGFQELACTDKPEVTVSKEPINPDTYHVLTNAAFLAIVSDAMASIPGAIVASVGSLCNRARIFVTLAIADVGSFQAAGREFKPYLNFLSSHDKSAEFTAVASTVCTVCNNTFSANLQNTEGDTLRIGIKHRPGMAGRLANVVGIIAAYYATVEHFKAVLNKLAAMPCTAKEAQAFFAGLLMDGEGRKVGDGLSTVSRNKVSRLVELFSTGAGNDGNGWDDVFQAVTDYYTHESAGPNADKLSQEETSEYKTGATKKARAYAVLQDDKLIADMMAKGAVYLTNTKAD